MLFRSPGGVQHSKSLKIHPICLSFTSERTSLHDTLIMGIRDADVTREKLRIPENEEIMSIIAVGKRSAEPSVRPRKELDEVVRFF